MNQSDVRQKLFRTALAVGFLGATVAAGALALDKSLPYRIGPGLYSRCLWANRLAMASLALGCLTLLAGIAARRGALPFGLAFSPLAFLIFMGGLHSGPNPEIWCFFNLRQIDAAKDQFAFRNNLNDGTAVSAEDISPYIKGGFDGLVCAEGGGYAINPIGTEPRCSFHGSMSEMEAGWQAEMEIQESAGSGATGH